MGRSARAKFVVMGAVLVAVAACSGGNSTVDGTSSGAPITEPCNKVCTCPSGTCTQTCSGTSNNGGCQMECRAGTTCTFDCPGGGCKFTCGENAKCTFKCAGGGCQTDCGRFSTCIQECPGNKCQHRCSSATTCSTTGCTQGCQVTCGSATKCDLSCTPENGGCVKT